MNREEAIERLKRGAPFSELYYQDWEDALEMAIEALENQKTGHWIETEDAKYQNLCYRCSECNTLHGHIGYKPNFCPNCGAKMEGE